MYENCSSALKFQACLWGFTSELLYDFSYYYLTGEVLFYGCESICNGEYGLPHCRNDGQARVSRLLCGGSHGQGNKFY